MDHEISVPTVDEVVVNLTSIPTVEGLTLTSTNKGIATPTIPIPISNELKVIENIENTTKAVLTTDPSIWISPSNPLLTFKLIVVPKFLLYEIIHSPSLKDPKPPVYMNDTKGRVEENPLDPEYLEALREATNQRANALNNIVVGFGTKLLTKSDDLPSVESNSWVEDLNELGIPTPIKGKARYLAWLKFVVLSNEDEFFDLRNKSAKFSGLIMESEVAEAEATFPNS